MKDGRKDFAKIAEEIGVSKNTIWKHYKGMEKSGIILGATLHLNHIDLGYTIAEILVLNPDSLEESDLQELKKKQLRIRMGIIRYILGALAVLVFLEDVNELQNSIQFIRQQFPFAEKKTQVWTGVRNIPENLSFGLPQEVINRISETQSQQTITTLRKKTELDETDMKIIDKLTENGRSSFSRIAQEIGVSTDTVARRYKRLKRSHIIDIVIQIDPRKIGYSVALECRMRLKSHKDLSSTIEAISKIPDVFHISATTGDYDLHIWALIRDIEHLLTIQEKIAAAVGSGRMEMQLSKTYSEVYPTPRWQTTTI